MIHHSVLWKQADVGQLEVTLSTRNVLRAGQVGKIRFAHEGQRNSVTPYRPQADIRGVAGESATQAVILLRGTLLWRTVAHEHILSTSQVTHVPPRAVRGKMFEDVKFLGEPKKSIALQTRKGTDIENQIGPAVTAKGVAEFKRICAKYQIEWSIRKPCTEGYNCAGHVWASRRTSVYDTSEVRKILSEDGYSRTDNPGIDDVVLYWNDRGEFCHVARIVEVRTAEGMAIRVPWVVSKVCDWGGEAVHRAHDFPNRSNLTIEYFTDRAQ